jgi:hypothetical protein
VLYGGFELEVLLNAEIDISNATFNQIWAIKYLSRK